jgi:Uma2 family endonuclease
MPIAQRDSGYHTYADYLGWPDDVRYELVEGVAYLMAPAPTRRHQEVVGEVFRQVSTALLGRRCRAYVSPFDVRLPRRGEDDALVDTVLQPDVAVFCDLAKLDDRGARGAPDWVVEVLSPATAAHDQTVKLRAYERAGVPELWLLHPADHTVAIYRLVDGSYGRPEIRETVGTQYVGAVTDVFVDWALVFAAD